MSQNRPPLNWQSIHARSAVLGKAIRLPPFARRSRACVAIVISVVTSERVGTRRWSVSAIVQRHDEAMSAAKADPDRFVIRIVIRIVKFASRPNTDSPRTNGDGTTYGWWVAGTNRWRRPGSACCETGTAKTPVSILAAKNPNGSPMLAIPPTCPIGFTHPHSDSVPVFRHSPFQFPTDSRRLRGTKSLITI